VAILKNLLDVVENASPSLRHVTFYQGGKAYGADLGPFKTRAREDDPRLMPPNFYYDQEDFLRERQQGKAWHWTALRPEATTGFGLGNPMNLGMSIAVYAAISKELGLPLRFPGTEKSYGILYQITSAEILAKATTWAGQAEAAKNEIFNVTNVEHDMSDPRDLSELSLQTVPVKQIRADKFNARRQRRGAARQSVDLRARQRAPILGSGAAAHSMDTCNQNDVLRRHLFSFRSPVVFLTVFIRPLPSVTQNLHVSALTRYVGS
jgi:progesterone 5beta-reductase/iridoid synthase-like 1,4-enone reductase family protein